MRMTAVLINRREAIGGVAEWLKAPVLKTGVAERSPWVRIPPPPPPSPRSSRFFQEMFEIAACAGVREFQGHRRLARIGRFRGRSRDSLRFRIRRWTLALRRLVLGRKNASQFDRGNDLIVARKERPTVSRRFARVSGRVLETEDLMLGLPGERQLSPIFQ